MTEETKPEDEPKKNFILKYPIASGLAGLALLVAGAGIATSKTYSTLAKAEVLDEQYVLSGEEKKPHQYVLHLKILDAKEDNGEIYTVHVVEDHMPIAVLDGIIGTGTQLYFPVLEEGILFTKPTPLYPVVRFGQLHSHDIHVLHPWESSEKVKRQLEQDLNDRKKREYKLARREAEDQFYGRIIW